MTVVRKNTTAKPVATHLPLSDLLPPCPSGVGVTFGVTFGVVLWFPGLLVGTVVNLVVELPVVVGVTVPLDFGTGVLAFVVGLVEDVTVVGADVVFGLLVEVSLVVAVDFGPFVGFPPSPQAIPQSASSTRTTQVYAIAMHSIGSNC